MVVENFRNLNARALLITIAVMATQTPALAAGLRNVCASYDQGGKTIRLEVANGCVSSSYKYVGHDIKIDIKEQWASISVLGGFKYDKAKTKVVKRDCMAGKKLEHAVAGVEPRRYSVSINGTYRGVFDFTQSRGRTCIALAHPNAIRGISTLTGQKALKKLLPEPEGTTIQEIVAPIMRSLAVSNEGHGTLSLRIEKTINGNQTSTSAATAEIEAHGLADDSVSGMHYSIDFVATPKGWKATALKRRQMCARGQHAGTWTVGNCS